VWPLNPKGEILVILMMEDTRGIENLPRILKEVPGIGVVLIGEGDLSQELGYPRQYEHPVVLEWMARVVKAPCGEQEPRAHHGRRLSLPDGRSRAHHNGAGEGPQARGAIRPDL
jgi:4-hydroxy-2-oxoheptanedioate aldolase